MAKFWPKFILVAPAKKRIKNVGGDCNYENAFFTISYQLRVLKLENRHHKIK
jgi:hypothetical protein